MRTALTSILLLMACARYICAQTPDEATGFSKTSSKVPCEKVYLHLDRNLYAAGDDIWFKAYLTDAVTNRLIVLSNNLYVELISPESKILQSITIRIGDGTVKGDFHLNDSIPTGRYQIRAYTNYMRNFGELFFFQKTIFIENHLGIKTNETPNFGHENKPPDVQFFPEGGSLIKDVPAMMGIKAINSDGKGCNVSGYVISSRGDTSASFSKTVFGMGNFSFTSNSKLHYIAKGVTEDGDSFKILLPEPLAKGYSMHLAAYNRDFVKITIKTNQETLEESPGKTLTIVGVCRNRICLTSQIKINSLLTSALLPKSEFFPGIACISIMDSLKNIYAERLVYIEKNENLKVHLETNKKEYAPREKVEVTIAVTDTLNQPVMSNMSLSVVNGNQIIEDPDADISTYMLLESDIKGTIEQPNFYFDKTNHNRQAALDNLLLTQGWRNYIWKQIRDSTIKIHYLVESGFSISGYLRRTLVDKPIKNSKVSLVIFEKGEPVFFTSKTDDQGRFKFDSLYFTGIPKIVVSSNFKERENPGFISIDSVKYNPFGTIYKWTNSNVSRNLKAESVMQDSVISTFSRISGVSYRTLKKYKVSDTLLLEPVIVKAQKYRIEFKDPQFRCYGEPDKTIDVRGLALDFSCNNVWQMLQYAHVNFRRIPWPKFYYDGTAISNEAVANLSSFSIGWIDISYDGKIIALYSPKYAGQITPLQGLSSISPKISGFYQARTFYAPKYDNSTPETNKPDLRTTIFWEPELVTDKDGKAVCSFFNSDEKGFMRINMEGLTDQGIPLVSKNGFVVQE